MLLSHWHIHTNWFSCLFSFEKSISCRDVFWRWWPNLFTFNTYYYCYSMHDSELMGSLMENTPPASLIGAWCRQGVANKVAGDLIAFPKTSRTFQRFPPCELFNFQKKISHYIVTTHLHSFHYHVGLVLLRHGKSISNSRVWNILGQSNIAPRNLK